MNSDEARGILEFLLFERDTEILLNDKEYYIRVAYPMKTFSIPKDGVLSIAKERKLMDIFNELTSSNGHN